MAIDRSGTCWKCGSVLDVGDYGRSESCRKCDSDTRSCRNCRFYDPSASRECREPSADPPLDKAKSNFCELFTPGAPKSSGPAQAGGELDSKSAFEKLFKQKPH